MLSGRQSNSYKIRVAGIIIQFTADDNLDLVVPEAHRSFIVDKGKPDFRLQIHFGPLPPLDTKEKLFESGSMWTLYRNNGGYAITFSPDIAGAAPYQVLLIDARFETGDLYIKPSSDTSDKEEPDKPRQSVLTRAASLIYPLIMISLLPRGWGVELHSCGVNYKGKGIIFTGGSGSGKSTLGRLWQGEKDARVLSDERIIIRKIDGRFQMYGTPWQSEARISSPEGVHLKNVFFIDHSHENRASPVKAGEAASRLFVRCFPTFWDETCLNYTLDFLGQLAEQIPCYELGFVPDKSALDFISKAVSGEPVR